MGCSVSDDNSVGYGGRANKKLKKIQSLDSDF